MRISLKMVSLPCEREALNYTPSLMFLVAVFKQNLVHDVIVLESQDSTDFVLELAF